MPQKYCRKFEPPEQGARTLQTTDRQTTDGRAIAYSEREREFTFAKNRRKLKRTKTKTDMAQKKQSAGQSDLWEERWVGGICERVNELWMLRVAKRQMRTVYRDEVMQWRLSGCEDL